MSSLNKEKIFNIFLLALGLSMIVIFFIIKTVGGDSANVPWRLSLTRFHLFHQLAMPYFSPAHCGGFHLAADAQDLIFTLYMGLAFLIPNVAWVVKITNFFSSLILGAGVFYLLRYLSISNLTTRIFTSILVVVSGYWICHIAHGGHAWGQGFAYLPWMLICMEEIFSNKLEWRKHTLFYSLALAALFFLIINSGYYWLQVAAPIIVLRLMIEVILADAKERKQQSFKVGLVLATLAVALLLSFPRLGGVYEYQLKKFPRLGGEVNAYQVVGGQKWFDLTFRSYFDGSIITESKKDSIMGFAWDYSNFIGLCALLPLIWGLVHCRKWFNSRLFITLGLAALFQLALSQGKPTLELLRHFVPLFKQITWYSRGSAMVLLFMAVAIAIGYESLLHDSKKIPFILIAALMTANLVEIMHVQMTQVNFKLNPPLAELIRDTDPPPYPADRPWGPCLLGYVYGYGNENPPQAKLSSCPSVYNQSDPNFYNLHDVRVLASSQADGGYYLKNNWPLWPKSDEKDFERFIHYQQVVPLPGWLKYGNWVSMVVWVLFLLSWVYVYRLKGEL